MAFFMGGVHRFINRELDVTDTELNAIAIPANVGSSIPLAATGIKVAL